MNIFNAIERDDLDEIDRLIQNNGDKLDLNRVSLDESGDSLLMAACIKGNPEIVRYLVDNGADINFKRYGDKHTCLMEAVVANNMAVVEYLLQHGANINDVNDIDKTALDLAKNPEMVNLFKKGGKNKSKRRKSKRRKSKRNKRKSKKNKSKKRK